MEKVPMTTGGFEALREELRRRQQEERPRIITAIAEARAHGDLSENAEYHSAKEAQSLNEGRIAELEDRFGPDGEIARPARWSGFRVRPLEIEFWQHGTYRLHDRFRFTRAGVDAATWDVARLYP